MGLSNIAKILGIFLLVVGGWSWYSTPFGIHVKGGSSTIKQTREALVYLRREAPEYFELVTNNIDTVRYLFVEIQLDTFYSGYTEFGDNGEVKVTILKDGSKQDVLMHAGFLAHEACHGKQFHEGRVPDMSEAQMEQECIQVQADALEKLGVKREVVDYYKNKALESKWWEKGYPGL
ncbi:hypothetical protein IPN35_01475 [Candidatus Peregrinibacteria bacterium]|nr:MAG: hypothetical protein IPN35_01475 [Candidatus Peregrinibacteria bacterium]